MHIRPYQQLIVWKEAHMLCIDTYQVTKLFPSEERYRLTHQMCRSSSSVPTNIAEGSGKLSKRERARFYEIAACSLEELHYQYILAKDLGYIAHEQCECADRHIGRVSYLLNKLRLSIR